MTAALCDLVRARELENLGRSVGCDHECIRFMLGPTHCEELKDLDCYAWHGKSLEKVQSADPEVVCRWLTDVDAAPHGGESIARLLERIEHWVAVQCSSGHTLAVTHRAVIRAAVVFALQPPAQSFWRIDVSPLSITDFRWNGRFWSLWNSGCPLFRHEN
jgi:broad specificity phosphatase PhoE